MKILSAVLGIAVLFLLGLFFYQHQKTTMLESSLVALGQDRDLMNKELRDLKRRMVDLQNRPVPITTSTSESVRERTAAAGVQSAPVATPIVPVERPGVTIKAPAGWWKNGMKPESYVVGVDSNETWGGMPSAYVQSLTPAVEGAFGGMMQTTAADNYVGKRVKLSGWIKTEDVEQGGQLWLRVDGQERGKVLQFDNMDNRAVKGTSDWQEASVVLDVPAGASALAYGFFVKGGGKMWVNGQRIEEVGADVPSTNMIKKPPTAPQNLGFDPNGPK